MSMIDVTRLSPVMRSRKLQIYEFICAFFAARGEGPTISEMCAAAGHCARSRVQDAIRKLEREQLIHRVPGKMRGITPIGTHHVAIRQLEALGYIVNYGAPLIDIDEDGALVITGGTKAGLPPAPARAHDVPIDAGTSAYGTEAGEARSAQGGSA